MDIKAIHTYLQADLARVEALIDASLSSDISLLDAVNRRLREHPGKMMRPMLVLLTARALGQVNENTYCYAAATELLHNATLLHDDVVDGATQRRGMPTVASLLSGSASVLLGDFWLVRCLDRVLETSEDSTRVLRLFSATLKHLAEGELLQMELAGKGSTTQEDYLRIVYGKTASLFVTAVVSGAISVRASAESLQVAERFAAKLGIAFQIKDDILDYADDASLLGKAVGVDLREQKITQPLLCALEQVSEREACEVRKQVAALSDHPEEEAAIRAFVQRQHGAQLAGEVMNGYLDEALSCLEKFPESEARAYLAAITRFVGDRVS